jgi:hypothetical protein
MYYLKTLGQDKLAASRDTLVSLRTSGRESNLKCRF